jgi:hypothetical protein
MKPIVLVLGPGPQALRELARYFALVHLPTANPLQLALAIVTRGAQIVHLHGSSLACLVVAKLLGARVVLENPASRFARLADAIIVRSAAQTEAFPGMNVAVVPEGIEAERLADDLTAIYSLVLPWPASQAG